MLDQVGSSMDRGRGDEHRSADKRSGEHAREHLVGAREVLGVGQNGDVVHDRDLAPESSAST